jgi:hypothetical protein
LDLSVIKILDCRDGFAASCFFNSPTTRCNLLFLKTSTAAGASGRVDLASGNLKLLSSGILDNAGQITWSDMGKLQLGQGAAVTNRGVFEVQNDVAMTMTPLVKRPIFVNLGTFRKTTAVGLSEFGAIEFRNSGTIDLLSGGIGFPVNNHTLSDGTRVTGPGSLWIYGADLTLTGTITSEAPLELSLGTLNGTNHLLGVVNCRGGTITRGATIEGILNVLGGERGGPAFGLGNGELEQWNPRSGGFDPQRHIGVDGRHDYQHRSQYRWQRELGGRAIERHTEYF